MDAAGDLFGTTYEAGPGNGATVFEVVKTASGYASTPIIVNGSTSLGGSVGGLLADKTTGNLFAPAGGGVGYGTEFEIINSGFVTASAKATATTSAAITATATTTVAAGSTLNVTGAESIPNLLDNGTVAIASGGSLDVSSAVDPSSSGVFQLMTKASLEIASILGTDKIQFVGSAPTNEQLTIDSTANFGTHVGTSSYAGPLLENFAAGDIIDLKDIASAGLGFAYSAASGDLQLTGSGGNALATLAFQNSTLGAGTFHTVSDGAGGTLITHS